MQLHDRQLEQYAYVRLQRLYREAEQARARTQTTLPTLRWRAAAAFRALASRLEGEPRSRHLSRP